MLPYHFTALEIVVVVVVVTSSRTRLKVVTAIFKAR